MRNPGVEVSPDGRLALIEAFAVGDSRDQRVLDGVQDLRSGSRWLPRILAFVLALSFVPC